MPRRHKRPPAIEIEVYGPAGNATEGTTLSYEARLPGQFGYDDETLSWTLAAGSTTGKRGDTDTITWRPPNPSKYSLTGEVFASVKATETLPSGTEYVSEDSHSLGITICPESGCGNGQTTDDQDGNGKWDNTTLGDDIDNANESEQDDDTDNVNTGPGQNTTVK